MKPIKIAHLATLDSFIKLYLLQQLTTIQEAGYSVTAVCSDGPDVPAIEAASVRHVSIPMTRAISPVADLGALWQLYRLMRREQFTIVHTHNAKPGLLGRLAARMAGVPVVIHTLHGFFFHDAMPPLKRRFYVAMERAGARRSDLILSQNDEDIQTALREGICPAEKIQPLGNGIDLRLFHPSRVSPEEVRRRRAELGIPADAKVVGFVGRLAAKRKGFLDFLKANEEVLRRVPGARVMVIGEPDHGKDDAIDPATLTEYAARDRWHFLGARPNADLPAYYAMMNVLVLPSTLEGLARVIMEAASMGVPAVATNVQGNRDAVRDGRTGLLVPYGDAAALANAISVVLTDREKAQAMGEEARRVAAERFDERVVFAKVKAEYERLLSRKGGMKR